MAKKTNGLKIVGIALLAIIGLGSISALARNKDKDEDKHVHDYTQTNVCSCGERQEEILLSDVKVGMDLSGYAARITVGVEEFNEVFYSQSIYNYSPIILYIKGQNFEIYTLVDTIVFAHNFNEQGRPTDEEQLIVGASSTDFIIPNGSIVENVNASGEYLDYFEFYYVGEAPAPASYALPKGKAAQKEPQVETSAPEKETEDFGCVGNELPENSDLWTTLF